MRNPTTFLFSTLVWCFAGTTFAAGGAALNWEFQHTGFQAGTEQTAVALRDNRVWPVIFAMSQSSWGLNAYSLMPVKNPGADTYWHTIGTELLPEVDGHLKAATSPDGRVAAMLTDPFQYSPIAGAAVIGQAQANWQELHQVNAVAFGVDGTLYTTADSTMASIDPNDPLVSLAVSPSGSLGAVDSNAVYYHYDAWLSMWLSEDLTSDGPSLDDAIQTVFDANGVPHVVGVSDVDEVVAYEFNTVSGQWEADTISTSSESIMGVALAADGQGRVGLAWAERDYATGENALKYACKDDGPEDFWSIYTVADGVYDDQYGYSADISSMQSVGLVYDNNDLPVISFIDDNHDIWLAYDPTATVPEPATWLLLSIGTVAFLVYRRKCAK